MLSSVSFGLSSLLKKAFEKLHELFVIAIKFVMYLYMKSFSFSMKVTSEI